MNARAAECIHTTYYHHYYYYIRAKYDGMIRKYESGCKGCIHIARNKVLSIVIVFEWTKNEQNTILRIILIKKQFKMNLVCNIVINESRIATEKKEEEFRRIWR